MDSEGRLSGRGKRENGKIDVADKREETKTDRDRKEGRTEGKTLEKTKEKIKKKVAV